MITKSEYEDIEKILLKYRYKGTFALTDETLKIIDNILTFKREIHENVKNGNFYMAYQPKINPDGKNSVGAEALFRMKSDYFINPEVVFTLFKICNSEKDVIVKQIEMLCKDISHLTQNIDSDYRISINVNIKLIDENFCKVLHENLKKNGISAKNIEIEILENEDFDNVPRQARAILKKLRDEGVKIALDDYGSFNADKSAYNRYNFDVLKIDKHIIDKANETNDYSEIKNIYKMAIEKNPNVEVVVEGVENAKEVKELQKIGNFSYQGFYFSKAIKIDDLIEKYGCAKTL